jgi:diadenosine tetraphosphate (Ap4A) HIT family hydrolase
MNFTDYEKKSIYSFKPESDWFKKLEKQDLIMSNDVFTKFKAVINNLSGELIVCSDLKKIDSFAKKIVPETYQEYLKIISERDFKKEQWVYNIFDGKDEQDKILYRQDLFLIIPTYTWDGNDLNKLHLLTFPIDKSLHTLRDLTGKHIELLINIKIKTLEIIKCIYGFDSDLIKMFIHYKPSTYQLHIHFVLITNTDTNSSVEYSHDLNMVIEILKIKSDFYQTTIINKRI